MSRIRHVQTRLDEENYKALQRWAETNNMSLTTAINVAVRRLTGALEQVQLPRA